MNIDLSRPCIEHTQAGERYARVWHRGRLRAQHVQAWEIANGREVPDGWEVDHLCFNERCILPAHLEAVPSIVNMRRRRTTQLTLEAVRQVRAEYAALPRTGGSNRVVVGARAALRQKYGLSHERFRDIIKGRTWRDDGERQIV